MAKIVVSAINFPITIFPTETGAVRINWSVLSLLSSAIIFIVRIGTVNTRIKRLWYTGYILVNPFCKL